MVDQEDQGDHNPPWWTRTGLNILLMTRDDQQIGLRTPPVGKLERHSHRAESNAQRMARNSAPTSLDYSGPP